MKVKYPKPKPTRAGASCRTPQKKHFRTEREAEQKMSHLWATSRGSYMPIRTYRCHCGKWCLTSKSK